ncbi:hydroxyacylglutathione hydrolase [Crenobacter sp. SG2305]|uniref:hydroxyacylglutathione hydrolase n=1 Tax=Crenobacter oryzisoli TaxID=3056844 RepID=UPI0025AB1CC6|nr:hydroxyacylglutathione hydrolase [Crenobacter sp. SG2305]MDN0081790.1 hydroxyacylglutathione hydrolase [Crenobacter sp. SG2305]
MVTVTPVHAFSDNYIWLLHSAGRAIAVDPGDATAVLAALAEHGLTLQALLITHHHADHVGGIAELKRHFPGLTVYGPAGIAGVTDSVMEGSELTLFGQPFGVLEVPGHTLDHIAYHGAGLLFCGDTLFGAGCGRMFEGSAPQFYASLQKLAGLPGDTLVYPAHEYTLSNLRFAQAVEPGNPALTERERQDSASRTAGRPTLPSTLTQELATNPFLRVDEPEVEASCRREAGHEVTEPAERFAVLRDWKNRFR